MTLKTFAALLVVLTALLAPRAAGAQIYSWRDANGTLVLSDRPRDGATATFPVTSAATVRSTRPAAPASRSRPYDHLVAQQASTLGVRADLVRAVIQVESAWNPHAVSPKGAMGLMQLMPATAAELGVRNAFDPAENVRGGVTYLRRLLDRYDGDEVLALAAYNAGPGAVERYGNQVPPFAETRQYVSRVRNTTPLGAAASPTTIFKTIELVDGRPVPRYSNVRPASGDYEVIRAR